MLRKATKGVLKYPIKIANFSYTYLYYKLSVKGNYEKDNMFSSNKKKILVLSPHVDDESIGLGGTLLKHTNRGDDITCVYITDGGSSDTSLSRSEIINTRKEEAIKVKKRLNFKEVIFLDEKDGKVNASNDLISEIYNILIKINPDVIYTNFLVDGHNDHVETTKALLESVKKWNRNFDNIFMYEINNPINPKLINSISVLNKEVYTEKIKLLDIFKSQHVMGFDAFLLLNRMKRYLIKEGYACESFIKVNVDTLDKINKILINIEFENYYFRQLSSEYNLILSFLKSKKRKKKYNNEIHKILKEDINGNN